MLHRPEKISIFFVIFSKNAKNDYDLIELKTHKNNDTTKWSTATWQDEAFPDWRWFQQQRRYRLQRTWQQCSPLMEQWWDWAARPHSAAGGENWPSMATRLSFRLDTDTRPVSGWFDGRCRLAFVMTGTCPLDAVAAAGIDAVELAVDQTWPNCCRPDDDDAGGNPWSVQQMPDGGIQQSDGNCPNWRG